MLPIDLDPPLRLLARFQDSFPTCTPEILYRPPDRDVWIAARLGDADDRHTLACVEIDGAPVAFSRQTARQKRTLAGRPLPRWVRFPAGVVLALAERGIDAQGIDAVVCSDEPPGPRYDYALCLAFAALWHDLAQQPHTPAGLMYIADAVTRTYVEAGG